MSNSQNIKMSDTQSKSQGVNKNIMWIGPQCSHSEHALIPQNVVAAVLVKKSNDDFWNNISACTAYGRKTCLRGAVHIVRDEFLKQRVLNPERGQTQDQ